MIYPIRQNVTVPAGTALSSVADLADRELLGLIMPGVWTAANLTFLVSHDGLTYFNLHSGGAEVNVATSANTWATMAAAPATVGAGGALAHVVSDFIYVFQGGGATGFWRYSISANTWATLPVDMLIRPPLRFEYVTRNKPRR